MDEHKALKETPALNDIYPFTGEEEKAMEALIQEYLKIQADIATGIIQQYSLPDEEQLKEIIEKAENYDANWYHSEVALPYSELERTALEKKVEKLGKEKGIYILYTALPDLSQYLEDNDEQTK